MGGGPSKKVIVNDIEKGGKSKSSAAGSGQEQAEALKLRGSQFEVSRVHLQSHETNSISCISTGKHVVTDFVVGINRTSQNQFQSILDQLNQGGGNLYYQDPNFPAQLTSLTKDIATFPLAQNLTWKRPQQFMVPGKDKGLGYYVFEKGIQPNDILQGDLGDCYFMSALSCLAEKPGMIERLFETADVSQQGCYCLWLCNDGEWKQVILDDFFPCFNEGGPAFSRSHDNELWVLLLEKAYAKMYGSYDKIESGLAGQAIHDLTGAPYQYFIRDHDTEINEEDVWAYVYDNVVLKHYIATASSEENSRELSSPEDTSGIVSNHSYSIIDAREVIDSEGQHDRILQIRNPWGQFEWKGDWSDNSYKWTQKLAQELHLQQSNDGLFWINTHDFLQKFTQIMVSKVEEGFIYSSLRATKAPVSERITTRIFTMKVFTSAQRCHIGVSQRDKRSFAKNPKIKNYNYSLIRLMVAQLTKDAPTTVASFVGSVMDCERDMSFEATHPLIPGVYLVYVEADWAQEDIRDFVVWCYGELPVEFLEVKQFTSQLNGSTSAKAGQAANYATLLDDLLEAHKAEEEQERIHKFNEQISRTTGSVCGYVYFHYENLSNEVHLREEIQMKNAQYLELIQPAFQVAENIIRVIVAPGERQIVKYRADARGRGEYSYNTSVNYILLQSVDHTDITKLTQLALLQPSKVKQREMHGYQMKVFVHTFVYYGGVCFLYVNKTSSKTYVEDLQLEVQNLRGDTHEIDEVVHLEVPPQSTQIINLLTIDLNEDIAYKPKMTYYLR